MAIYDNDGMVNSEIMAIYDNDGTTNYLICKDSSNADFKLIDSIITEAAWSGGSYYPETAQSVSITVPAGYEKVLVVASDFVSNTTSSEPILTISTSTGTYTELSSEAVVNRVSGGYGLGFYTKSGLITGISDTDCTITATAGTKYNAVALKVFAIE